MRNIFIEIRSLDVGRICGIKLSNGSDVCYLPRPCDASAFCTQPPTLSGSLRGNLTAIGVNPDSIRVCTPRVRTKGSRLYSTIPLLVTLRHQEHFN